MRRRIPKGRRERESGSVREVMTDRAEKKRISRGTGAVSTDSSEDESDDSSDSPFQLPPSRQGAELWRLAQKYPGRLLKSGLIEMSRYLADRRHRGQLAQQEGDGLCQPGAVTKEPEAKEWG